MRHLIACRRQAEYRAQTTSRVAASGYMNVRVRGRVGEVGVMECESRGLGRLALSIMRVIFTIEVYFLFQGRKDVEALEYIWGLGGARDLGPQSNR
jgi:hypothetical protein